MAVAVEPLAQAERHPVDRRAPLLVVRWAAAMAAVAGMVLALFFGVVPIHITVHDRVGVLQAGGEQGTSLTLTGQTRPEVRQVSCVPLLRYDDSSGQDSTCAAKVAGTLRLAGIWLLVFLVGTAGWILSGGDRVLGLSGHPASIRTRLP
jgi:hypothetical protein